MSYLKSATNFFQANAVKSYLIIANLSLVVFAVWFSGIGILPFRTTGDFFVFAMLVLILAIYRPGWAFLFFVGSIALENINLAPQNLGIAVRPYQLLGGSAIISLFLGFLTKRLRFGLPKWDWPDGMVAAFVLAGFLSSLFASSSGASFKQSLVAASFAALYFLVRIYIRSTADLKRVALFFFSSSIVVIFYGILQNVLFSLGKNASEAMPGRPNATFTEADWLGIYLVFLSACIFSIIYHLNKKTRISNDQPASRRQADASASRGGFSIFKQFSIIQFFNYVLLTLIFTTLILTVSRSAWLGAAVSVVMFLLAISLEAGWKGFLFELRNVSLALVFGLGIVYAFHLTTFQIGSRAASTGGLQKITISCETKSELGSGSTIDSVDELAEYGCHHINLEDIEEEKAAGNTIKEVYRPDPNIGIRSKIYQASWQQIKSHPIFGIGWGNIGSILGTDERGASLNASNIFLETWLGAGLPGILSLVILLGYIFVRGIRYWMNAEDKTVSVFVLLGLFAVIIPNLFNSGIFLGFVWVYLATAVSLLKKE